MNKKRRKREQQKYTVRVHYAKPFDEEFFKKTLLELTQWLQEHKTAKGS